MDTVMLKNGLVAAYQSNPSHYLIDASVESTTSTKISASGDSFSLKSRLYNGHPAVPTTINPKAITTHPSASKESIATIPQKDDSVKDMSAENKEYFYNWQQSWKAIFSKSVVYLDGSSSTESSNSNDPSSIVGRDKIRSHIKMNCFKFHAKVVDFFNADEVTIIITRRHFDSRIKYPKNDIFYHAPKIRIWTFEKAVKFFARLQTPADVSEEYQKKCKQIFRFTYDNLKENEVKRIKALNKEHQLSSKDKSEPRIEFVSSTHKDSHVEHNDVKNASKNNNRMRLINNLRKTSQTLPTPSTSQKNQQAMNFQKQVFQKINYQKNHYNTGSVVTNRLQFQTPIIKKGLSYKTNGYQSNYQKFNPYKTSDKLATLLTKEKLHGPTDRDPNARPYNFYNFEHPFVFVFDLQQMYRPLITSEWPTKNYPNLSIQSPWAKFYPTVDGRCLFLPDSIDPENPAVVTRRKQIFDSKVQYRAQLRQLFMTESVYHGESKIEELSVDDYNLNNSKESMQKLPKISLQNTFIENNKKDDIEDSISETSAVVAKNVLLQNHRKRSFYEMNASGIAQSNSQSTASQATGTNAKFKINNGLGPTQSHVASKEFKSLKKRVYEKDHTVRQPMAELNVNNTTTVGEIIQITSDHEDGRQQATKKANQNKENTVSTIVHQTRKHKNEELGQDPIQEKTQLKKRHIEKKKGKLGHSRPLLEELKYGYCENCRIRYPDFDEHIRTAKHRDFAKDDRNFAQIDDFIKMLHSSMDPVPCD